jgi:hypothetical protein
LSRRRFHGTNVKSSQDNLFLINIIMDMPTSNQLVKEIKSAQQRLKVAEKDLRAPRAPIILGPMDVVTPWTEDANRVN